MPKTMTLFSPICQLYDSLERGQNFSPSESQVDRAERLGADVWRELATAWAAGFFLAHRLDRLGEFASSLMDCPYYCAWAVTSIDMRRDGLAEFLRIGADEEDGGVSVYRAFFRLARGYSMSTQRGFYGPDRPFLLTENCAPTSQRMDLAYDERVVVLAYELADLLIRQPADDGMARSALEAQHLLLVRAFVDEFSGIRLDPHPGSRKRPGIRRLVVDTWRVLSDQQQSRMPWLAPLIAELGTAGAKPRAKASGLGPRRQPA